MEDFTDEIVEDFESSAGRKCIFSVDDPQFGRILEWVWRVAQHVKYTSQGLWNRKKNSKETEEKIFSSKSFKNTHPNV